MDQEFHSIVEKLAILEGRIAPKDKAPTETSTKQKKPALFNNLKKTEKTNENMPELNTITFAEDKMEEDVVSKVKASLADYLKTAEEDIKQDRDLLKKKKEDLDIKKKELKDLDLQQKHREETEEGYDMDQLRKDATAGIKSDMDKASDKRIDALKNPAKKPGFMAQVGDKIIGGVKGAAKGFMHGSDAVEEAIPMTLEEQELQIGDPVEIVGDVEFSGTTGEIVDFGQRSNFVIVNLYNHGTHSFNAANVKYNEYADDEDADEYGEYEDDIDEDETYAQSGNSTYAQNGISTYESAPVKTVEVPLEEQGGGVLVEIHGDERDGFCIRRAGRDLPTRFTSLAEAEMALEMFNAHRKARLAAEQSADYIEEK